MLNESLDALTNELRFVRRGSIATLVHSIELIKGSVDARWRILTHAINIGRHLVGSSRIVFRDIVPDRMCRYRAPIASEWSFIEVITLLLILLDPHILKHLLCLLTLV